MANRSPGELVKTHIRTEIEVKGQTLHQLEWKQTDRQTDTLPFSTTRSLRTAQQLLYGRFNEHIDTLYDTMRYDTRSYFNVRSIADKSA